MNAKPKTLGELQKFVRQMSKRVLAWRNRTLELVEVVQRLSGSMTLLSAKQIALEEEVRGHAGAPHASQQEVERMRARCDRLLRETDALGSRLTEIESARAGEDARAIADLSERVAAIQERLATPGPAKSEPEKQAEAYPSREMCRRFAQVLRSIGREMCDGLPCFCGNDPLIPTHTGQCLDARQVLRDYERSGVG